MRIVYKKGEENEPKVKAKRKTSIYNDPAFLDALRDKFIAEHNLSIRKKAKKDQSN